MKVSVIIPAFNEEKLLPVTLVAVKAACQSFADRGWEHEIVVCNNNSTDRTAEVAQNSGAKVIFEPVNQIARARNTGASAATGDWFVFVDADSQPSAALFAEVAEVITAGKALAGGVTVRMDEFMLAPWLLTNVWNCLSRLKSWAAGSFIFVEAKAFKQVGGFSHELYASEEIELSERLKSLARTSGRTMQILHRHPLITSARKMHLYSRREHARFLIKTILGRGRNLKKREECVIWYDGRR